MKDTLLRCAPLGPGSSGGQMPETQSRGRGTIVTGAYADRGTQVHSSPRPHFTHTIRRCCYRQRGQCVAGEADTESLKLAHSVCGCIIPWAALHAHEVEVNVIQRFADCRPAWLAMTTWTAAALQCVCRYKASMTKPLLNTTAFTQDMMIGPLADVWQRLASRRASGTSYIHYQPYMHTWIPDQASPPISLNFIFWKRTKQSHSGTLACWG